MGDDGVVLAGIDLSKTYGGVYALRDVSLELAAGEVHVLIGENGAGKSTFVRLLTGAIQPDSGRVELDGRPVVFASPTVASEHGVVAVYQELSLVPQLTVAENVALKNRQPGLLLRRREMRKVAIEALDRLGAHVPVDARVSGLSAAQQQLVEIAGAIAGQKRVLILDEPTSSLSEVETGHLFAVIRRLQEQGIAMLYVSHRLQEIQRVASRISVFRDGKFVRTLTGADTPTSTLIRLMVDREVDERHPHTPATPGPEILSLEDVSGRGVHGVSLTVRAGEVVGLAGLLGSGRSELAKVICGASTVRSGKVKLDDRTVMFRHVGDAVRAGVMLVPEDRKREGLVPALSIAQNMALPAAAIGAVPRVVTPGRLGARSAALVDRFRIRCRSVAQEVRTLSGGNQQKVVVAKWLALRPRVIVFDEPTRGIDVGARSEIYSIIDQLSADGVAIVVISSDLPELLSLADRVAVMHDGRIVNEFPRGVTQEQIMEYATGLRA